MKNYYSDQYQHPNWQKKRLEMLTAADFKCELCHDTETQLHVHHRFYRKGAKVWEYEDHQFAVLCDECHQIVHGKHPEFTPESYWFMACFITFLFSPNIESLSIADLIWTRKMAKAYRMSRIAVDAILSGNTVKFPECYSEHHQRACHIALASKTHRSVWESHPYCQEHIRHGVALGTTHFGLHAAIWKEALLDSISYALPMYHPKSWILGEDQFDAMYYHACVTSDFLIECHGVGVLSIPTGGFKE